MIDRIPLLSVLPLDIKSSSVMKTAKIRGVNSETVHLSDILYIQESMDNTSAGASLPTIMDSPAFKTADYMFAMMLRQFLRATAQLRLMDKRSSTKLFLSISTKSDLLMRW